MRPLPGFFLLIRSSANKSAVVVLEIASQGKTVQEARENLEEAIRLFFEVASYTEIMEYLSRLDPVSPSEIQGKPDIRVVPTHHNSQQVKCEIALNNAWTQT